MKKTYRPSYASFWNIWLLLLIGAFLALAPTVSTDLASRFINLEGMLEMADLVVRITGIVALAWSAMNICYQRIYSHYSLFDDRIEAVHGILRRRTSTAELNHIRSIDVEKSLPGMLLGYGDLMLGTAGTGQSNVVLKGVDDPDIVKTRIRELQHLLANPQSQQEPSMPSESQPPVAPAPPAPELKTSPPSLDAEAAPDAEQSPLPAPAQALNEELDRRVRQAPVTRDD